MLHLNSDVTLFGGNNLWAKRPGGISPVASPDSVPFLARDF
jgi:hypothetical protein